MSEDIFYVAYEEGGEYEYFHDAFEWMKVLPKAHCFGVTNDHPFKPKTIRYGTFSDGTPSVTESEGVPHSYTIQKFVNALNNEIDDEWYYSEQEAKLRGKQIELRHPWIIVEVEEHEVDDDWRYYIRAVAIHNRIKNPRSV